VVDKGAANLTVGRVDLGGGEEVKDAIAGEKQKSRCVVDFIYLRLPKLR